MLSHCIYRYTQIKWFFWSNPYKIEIIVTSFTEMLELLNVGHMTSPTIQLKSLDKILLVTSWSEIMTS